VKTLNRRDPFCTYKFFALYLDQVLVEVSQLPTVLSSRIKKYLTASSSFFRIFLFRDISSVEGRVCYIIEGSNMNVKVWSRFLELRDNGALTIGSFIAVLNPDPVKKYFCNEMPIVECFGGCIVMKMQASMASIAPDHTIGSNETRSFVLNNVLLKLNQQLFVNTSVQDTYVIGRG